jgi:hypothetical protein
VCEMKRDCVNEEATTGAQEPLQVNLSATENSAEGRISLGQ